MSDRPMKDCSAASRRRSLLALATSAFVLLLWGAGEAPAGAIRLQSGTFDTSKATSAKPGSAAAAAAGAENRVAEDAAGAATLVRIVQFEGQPAGESLGQLRALGVRRVGYIPDHAYWCEIPAGALAAVERVQGVAWVGRIPSRLKVHPQVRERAAAAKSARTAGKGTTKPAAEVVRLKVLTLRKDAAAALAGLAGVTVERAKPSRLGYAVAEVLADPDAIDTIASLDSVIHVENAPEYRLNSERGIQALAGVLQESRVAPLGPGFTDWLTTQGLTGGAGLIVQVQDDGLDQGIATGEPGTAHPDLIGRIAGVFNATGDASADGQQGHGTLNASLIMGNGATGLRDAGGYLYGQGVAPRAAVYGTKIFDNSGTFDIGNATYADLAEAAQASGAKFSSNSFSDNLNLGLYTSDCADFDALVRDANQSVPGDQPIVYFCSSGNRGPTARTVGAPGSGKNIITVGACENTDQGPTDGCGFGPADANSNLDMASFSSRGPTLDGRFGITVIAAGTHMTGAASTVSTYDGIGICDKYFPAGQTLYARSTGTSHSTPIVCGAGMLIYEFFMRRLSSLPTVRGITDPSPALIKAALMSSAEDHAGGVSGFGVPLGNAPDANQGWGAVNLTTFFAHRDALFAVNQSEVFDWAGQRYRVSLARSNPTEPVRIVLAWTDVPATPGAEIALVNDLDLVVRSGGVAYFGNVYSGGVSITGGSPDRRNNVESVTVPAGTDPIEIEVSAAALNGRALQSRATELNQDFALIALNASDLSPRGLVTLERSDLRCSDTLVVRLSDSSLSSTLQATVQLASSAGDAETIVLAENPTSPGFFEGTIALRNAAEVEPAPPDSFPRTPGNGFVEVADGEGLTVTYFDADTGTGASGDASTTATIDCVAPTIYSTRILDVLSYQARVEAVTDPDSLVRVQHGIDCGTLDRFATSSYGTTHTLLLNCLPGGVSNFAAVEAIDRAGNVTRFPIAPDECLRFDTPEIPNYWTRFNQERVFPLRFRSLSFTPDPLTDGTTYSACIESIADAWPSDPSGGTALALGDDSFSEQLFPNGQTFRFYGVQYDRVFICANGFVTFGRGDSTYQGTIANHFAAPRISALFTDLTPPASDTVTWKVFPDRGVATWSSIPEYDVTNVNQFQIELYWNGKIKISWRVIEASGTTVGLSRGLGQPCDFAESDLAATATCIPPTATPTATPSPSLTPSPSVTPTPSPTPSVTPTASATATPSLTPTPSLSPTPSVSPTATPSPTPSVTPTQSPSPTPSPSLTPTASPSPSATASLTPSPTASLTASPTPSVTPSPSVTQTPSPTPTPWVASFDFTPGTAAGWSLRTVGSFDAPTTRALPGTQSTGGIALLATTNTQTFGYLESAPLAAPLPAPGSDRIFLLQAKLRGYGAARAEMPSFRVRANAATLESSAFLAIESARDGAASPGESSAQVYRLWFEALSPSTGMVSVAVDLLNFASDDAARAGIVLEQVSLTSVVNPFGASGATPRREDTGFVPLDWDFSAAEPLIAPGRSAGPGGLTLTSPAAAGSGDATVFGYFGSQELAMTTAGRIYRLEATVGGNLPSAQRAEVPQFRLRLNEGGLHAASVVAVESRGEAGRSPVAGTDSVVRVYYDAPSGVARAPLFAAFDYLNISGSGDAAAATLTLRDARLDSVELPTVPALP